MTEYLGRAEAQHAFAEHEHRELTHGIDRIGEVARMAGRVTSRDLAAAVGEIIEWFENVLQPHVAWENTYLYSQIDRRAGTPWATRLMRFEHQQIRAVARRLDVARIALHGSPTPEQLCEVRGHLFALDALLRAHVAREEAFLLPLLIGDGAVAAGALD